MNARKRPEPEMGRAEIEHTLNTALTYDCICPRDLNTSGIRPIALFASGSPYRSQISHRVEKECGCEAKDHDTIHALNCP
jgi:hypothetical protein